MSKIIETLRSLDRKERFAVLREALGFDRIAPGLSNGFRERLSACIDVPVPDSAFVAMDYHLDWIQIALHLAKNPGIDLKNPFESPDVENINKNQQDIDLLVAFDAREPNGPTTHLLLIEAKAYLPWTNKQLESKTDRLRKIFGDDGTQRNVVEPHFVLMTGHISDNIRTCGWPGWTTDEKENPLWLEYDLPCRHQVTRCAPDRKADKDGGYLRIDPVPR